MTTPQYHGRNQRNPQRNGWQELAIWLFSSRWGVRLLLLIAAAVSLAIYWKAILNLAFTGFSIVLILAIMWAMIPKKAKKKL